jgi:hypothetical protein
MLITGQVLRVTFGVLGIVAVITPYADGQRDHILGAYLLRSLRLSGDILFDRLVVGASPSLGGGCHVRAQQLDEVRCLIDSEAPER